MTGDRGVDVKRPVLLVPLLLSLAALPASAGEHAEACGDTAPVLSAGPVTQGAAAERSGGFDIRSLGVRDLVVDEEPAGVVVTLSLCGTVPAPELPGSFWQVAWQLPGLPAGEDECSGGLVLNDSLDESDGRVVRSASLVKRCTSVDDLPVLNGVSATTYGVYDVALPAESWRVAGDVVEWTLPRGAALGAGAEQVEPGTVLARPVAYARDGRQVTVVDHEGVRATGPGTSDEIGAGPDHGVG